MSAVTSKQAAALIALCLSLSTQDTLGESLIQSTLRESQAPMQDLSDTLQAAGDALTAGGTMEQQLGERRNFEIQKRADVEPNQARRAVQLQTAEQVKGKYQANGQRLMKRGAGISKAARSATALSLAGSGVEAYEAHQRGDHESRNNIIAQEATDVVLGDGVASAMRLAGPPGVALGAAYNGGFAAGSMIRNTNTCPFTDCQPGQRVTVQDRVTDIYVDAFEAFNTAMDAMQNEHRSAAQATRGHLEARQRQVDERRALAVSQSQQTAQSTQSGSGLMDTLLQGVFTGAVIASQLPSNASGACHPGHDEQAHPGGCHEDPLN